MDKFKLIILENLANNTNPTFVGVSTCLDYLLTKKICIWSETIEYLSFNKPSGRTKRIAKALHRNTKGLVGHSHYLVFFKNHMDKYFKD